MRPTKRHMAVAEYVAPAAFDAYKDEALRLGFKYAAAGPLVRSSYRAGELYLAAMLKEGMGVGVGGVAGAAGAV